MLKEPHRLVGFAAARPVERFKTPANDRRCPPGCRHRRPSPPCPRRRSSALWRC